MTSKKKIVTIGGGTGTFTVLSGLKKYIDQIELAAVVTMADSGGSTGRLRDEFGQLPVGDVRMALVALAGDELADHQKLRELFLYRFEKGGDALRGHNFGNLFLVALTEILGSEVEAIRFASRMLQVAGEVYPVTTDNVTLVATYDDGVVVRGETHIDEPTSDRDLHRIVKLTTEPSGMITPEAHQALLSADLIVLGPGDLYTSVLATVVTDGVLSVLNESSAKLLYVSNLMSKYGQTSGMSVEDHVREIEKYTGRSVDTILRNNTSLPEELLTRYKEESEYPVLVDGTRTLIECDLLAQEEVVRSKSDTLKRSLIRHDAEKLARAIMRYI